MQRGDGAEGDEGDAEVDVHAGAGGAHLEGHEQGHHRGGAQELLPHVAAEVPQEAAKAGSPLVALVTKEIGTPDPN